MKHIGHHYTVQTLYSLRLIFFCSTTEQNFLVHYLSLIIYLIRSKKILIKSVTTEFWLTTVLAQAMAGNQGVLGPTKIYLAVQPATPPPLVPPESPKAKVVVQQVANSEHTTPVRSFYHRRHDTLYAPAKCRLIIDDNTNWLCVCNLEWTKHFQVHVLDYNYLF